MTDKYCELLQVAGQVGAGLVASIEAGGAERDQLLEAKATLAVRFAAALIAAAKAAAV